MKALTLTAYLGVVPFAWAFMAQTTPPTLTEAKSLIDHAAAQNDRWLFIVLLVVLVGGLLWDKNTSRKEVRGMFDEMRLDRKESDKVVDRNTEALIRVEDVLNRKA